MGRKMRLELTTSGTTNQRSNQLSYIRQRTMVFIFADFLKKVKKKNEDPYFERQYLLINFERFFIAHCLIFP